MLFQHRHSHETAPYHVEILDNWSSNDEFIGIEAFREGAKSTLCEESIILEAEFGNFHYCLLVGETFKKACQRLAAIKYELKNNDQLRKIFGKLRPTVWNENEIELENGPLRIEALGWDQEIRSYKFLQWRPDLCILDDIENKVTTRSSDVVTANW